MRDDWKIGDRVKWYDHWTSEWCGGTIENIKDEDCLIKLDKSVWKHDSQLQRVI